jgi:DNA repair protein RadC
MTDVASHDRPREKLLRSGAAVLGDNELLAIVLGHGSQGHDALAVANRILTLAGGLLGLTRMHHGRLASIPGIGPAQSARIAAAVELGRRTLSAPAITRPKFLSPREIAKYVLPLYGAYPVERFGVVLMDRRSRLIGTRIVSTGILDSSLAHPREIFREALVAGAAALAVFHNHPSGDPRPSQDDLALTHRLKHAGILLGVDFVDHLILADAQYCSMKESQLL